VGSPWLLTDMVLADEFGGMFVLRVVLVGSHWRYSALESSHGQRNSGDVAFIDRTARRVIL
jgi:hypothetical protein